MSYAAPAVYASTQLRSGLQWYRSGLQLDWSRLQNVLVLSVRAIYGQCNVNGCHVHEEVMTHIRWHTEGRALTHIALLKKIGISSKIECI